MITKTYKCPNHGEFDVEMNINDEELKICPQCGNKVTRVFKPIHYTDCVGFAGRSYVK